ncbi:MAG: hypothetical protein IPK19_21505 [Chloroflexi bacterium]|nr:hypothetical protein [Chloroflexota bacterium]
MLARHSSSRGEIMQYRTQEENIGSQRTAIKAGFIRWYCGRRHRGQPGGIT